MIANTCIGLLIFVAGIFVGYRLFRYWNCNICNQHSAEIVSTAVTQLNLRRMFRDAQRRKEKK